MRFLIPLICLVSAQAFAGGVTGGGGNTQPVNHVSAAKVKTFLRGARQYVLFYLHHLDSEYGKGSAKDPLLDKLLRGPISALDLARKVDISLAEHGPCYYSDHVPVDGSASAGSSPTVCISTSRLAAVLSVDTLPPQAVALLLHEYSHLVGFTEREAVAIQQRMLVDVGATGIGKLDQNLQLFQSQIEAADNVLDFLVWERAPDSWSERTYSIIDVGHALSTMMNQDSLQALQILTDHNRALLFMSNLRIFVLHFGSCAMDGGTWDGQSCSHAVTQIFGGRNEVTGSELAAGFGDGPGGNDPPFYADLRYGRIVDKESFLKEVRRLKGELHDLHEQITLDQRPFFR